MTRVQALFIENLKKERKRAGYSQEKLAELVGLTPKYISSLEIGNRFPSPDTIQKIVDVFKMEPYQLLLDSSAPDKSLELEAVKGFEDFLLGKMPEYLREAWKEYFATEAKKPERASI